MKCDILAGFSASVGHVKNNPLFRQLSAETDNLISRVPYEYVQQQFVSVGVNVKQFYTDIVQEKLENVVKAGETTLEDLLVKARVVGEKLGYQPSPQSEPEACGSDGVSIEFKGEGEFEPTTSEITGEVVSGSLEQVNVPAPLSIESQEDSVSVSLTDMIRASTNTNRAEDPKSDILELGSSVDDSSVSSKFEHTCVATGDVSSDSLPLITQDDSYDTFESEDMATTDCPTKDGMSSPRLENDESCVVVDVDEPFSAPENETEPVQKYLRFTPFPFLKSAQNKKQRKASFSEDHNGGTLGSLNQHSFESESESEWVIV